MFNVLKRIQLFIRFFFHTTKFLSIAVVIMYYRSFVRDRLVSYGEYNIIYNIFITFES